MPSAVPISVRSSNDSFVSHPHSTTPAGHSRQSFKSPASLSNFLSSSSFDMNAINNIKMLGTSLESDRGRSFKAFLSDNPLAKDDFCRDFTCCGLVLSDLHSLLQHYEDVHVVVMDSPSDTPQVKPTGLAGAAFDPESMELDAEPPSGAVATSALAAPVQSAFDTSVLRASRSSSTFPPIQTGSRTTSPTRSGASTPSSQRFPYGLDSPASPASSITPALLSAPSTPFSSRPSSPTSDSTTTVSRPSSSLTRSKPFRCPTPGCNKQYLQANGLKYHRLHGQCNFASRDPSLEGLTEQEAEERLRPYACAVGGNCERRYKNMNGLRYHYQHSGAHGAIGLALLASGQHHPLPGKSGQSHQKQKTQQQQQAKQQQVPDSQLSQQQQQSPQLQMQMQHPHQMQQTLYAQQYHGYAIPMGDISMGD